MSEKQMSSSILKVLTKSFNIDGNNIIVQGQSKKGLN
jgi:septum formation topological specificity factor MinE